MNYNFIYPANQNKQDYYVIQIIITTYYNKFESIKWALRISGIAISHVSPMCDPRYLYFSFDNSKLFISDELLCSKILKKHCCDYNFWS